MGDAGKLDEAARRRPDGLFDAPVVLADGQTWWLPKPRVVFADDAGESGFRAVLSLGPADDYQGLVDALDAAEALPDDEPGRAARIVGAEFALARALVLRNYDLGPAERSRVIRFGYDAASDPGAADVRRAVLDVAYGVAPKASGGTSD
jgi:hypothetical protein